VESLHHFTEEEKLSLYRKLHSSLRNGGQFILTDYFASSASEESALAEQYLQLRQQQGIEEGVICHFDTPFTVYHETAVLLEAGFSGVEILRSWAATYTLRAVK
jgi:tRNA (cmo5U34)-methyltransferase